MMPGQRAGVRGQQRHERVAGQSEPAQHAIHHERRARQIARVLEQADQEEQQADLRQEHHRAGDAADDALRPPGRGPGPRAAACAAHSRRGARTSPRSDPSGRWPARRASRTARPSPATKTSSPSTGWVKRLSSRSVSVSGASAPTAVRRCPPPRRRPRRSESRSTSLRRARRPPAPAARGRCVSARASALRTSSRPLAAARDDRHDRTAEALRQLATRRGVSPRRCARSTMLSATTTGRS